MGHRTLRRWGDPNVQIDGLRRRVEMLERRHYDAAGYVTLERKLFADENALDGNLPTEATDVVVGDGKFVFSIHPLLDQWYLVMASAFVSAVGGGDTVVQVENLTGGGTMLTSGIVIPAGEFTSTCDLDDLDEINLANDRVDGCDMISINVTAAGDGAKGLGVYLTLSDYPLDGS